MIDWPARFAEVVRRRTREALAAELPPFAKVEIGAIHDLDTVGNQWTRQCGLSK